MRRVETDRLVLRKLDEKDAAAVERYSGEYELAKTTLSIPYPYPKGGGIQFIQTVERAEKKGVLALFAVEEKQTGDFIGVINVNVNKAHRRGELAYWIGRPFWKKGFGTEAAGRMLDYAFTDLNLNKVHAAAFASNPGSWRIMEKIGMTREGVLKQHLIRFGEAHDVVYYGKLKDEHRGGNEND